MKLLGARERSEAQLRAALERKGHSESEIDATVVQLKRLKYLDDRRVAESKARTELTARQSKAAVARKLAAIGVDEAVGNAAVRRVGEELGHDDEAAARAVLKQRKLAGVKAARFLAGRGFDEALIRRLVDLPDE